MNTRVHAELKTPGEAPVPLARSSRLQQKPVSSGSTAGHDFSSISIYAAQHPGGIFIDGPDQGTKTAPPPPAPKKPAKGACPTDIKIVRIDQIDVPDFFKHQNRTGIGAIAHMEVSDPAGNDWDGISVAETVKRTNNTCGDWARDVCSNKSGEDVDFKVGAETKILDIGKVSARKNTLHDLHVFSRNDASILHQLDKNSCEVQCSQTYHCGGKQLGPEFTITYSATKDTVAKTYDVTRIKVDKAPKAAKP